MNAINQAKTTAVGKRIAVWSCLSCLVFESYFLSILILNEIAWLYSWQIVLSLGLFISLAICSMWALFSTKSNFGSSNLRTNPISQFYRCLLFNGCFGTVFGSLLVCLVMHDASFSIQNVIVPVSAATYSLFKFARNGDSISDVKLNSFRQSYTVAVKKHATNAIKISLIFSVIVAVLIVGLQLVMSGYKHFFCVSGGRCLGHTALSVLLPSRSLWLSAYLSFIVTFTVHLSVGVLSDSLLLMLRLPIDFTKLLTSTSLKQVATTATLEDEKRSYTDEVPLITALTAGLILPASPIYPWLRLKQLPAPVAPVTSSTFSTGIYNRNPNRPSSSSTTAASGGDAAPAESQLVRLSPVTVVHDPSDPHWRVAQKIQQRQTEDLLCSAEYNVLDPACLPYFGEIRNQHHVTVRQQLAYQQNIRQQRPKIEVAVALTSSELLFRSLALHDLNRVAQCSLLRRQTIFTQHWAEVVFSVTALIDATALQLHFIDVYLNEGVVGPVAAEDVTAQFDEKERLVREEDSRLEDQRLRRENEKNESFLAAVKRATESTDPVTGKSLGRFSPVSEVKQFKANVVDATTRVVAAVVPSDPNKPRLYLRWLREQLGYTVKNRGGEMHSGMFPPMMAQSVANGVEALSLLLVAALSEDMTGLVQHHVPAVLDSLLRLEHAMKSYSDTVHQTFFSHFNKMGKTHRIQYRVRSVAHLPKGMQLISVATDEALGRLVVGYRDVVKSCNFADPLYAKALQTRVAAII